MAFESPTSSEATRATLKGLGRAAIFVAFVAATAEVAAHAGEVYDGMKAGAAIVGYEVTGEWPSWTPPGYTQYGIGDPVPPPPPSYVRQLPLTPYTSPIHQA